MADSSDDAEERASGRVNLTSSDLELIFDKEDQTVGMRFTGVGIPRGATVERAYLQLQVDEMSVDYTALTIFGEATGNAPTFLAQDNNISSRTRTSASVWWPGVVEWSVVGTSGVNQRSPDMSPIIQEIVDRGDWAAGNDLVVMITGTGERGAESYDGDPGGAPLLHVEYSGAGGASSTITTSTSTTTSTTSTTRQGVCGDHQLDEPFEECDGPEDSACPGFCLASCRCGLVNVRVASSSDDAEERDTGRVDLTSSDLELVYDKSDQQVGMRFAGVMIPPGAMIERAYLQFQVDEASLDHTNLTIVGEAAGDAPTFSSRDNDISSRIPTSAEVWWPGVVEWPLVGRSDVDQRSPDISPVIQEIVDRTDWAEGNGLVIIITGSGERVAEAYDGDPAGAPLLHVEYGTGD